MVAVRWSWDNRLFEGITLFYGQNRVFSVAINHHRTNQRCLQNFPVSAPSLNWPFVCVLYRGIQKTIFKRSVVIGDVISHQNNLKCCSKVIEIFVVFFSVRTWRTLLSYKGIFYEFGYLLFGIETRCLNVAERKKCTKKYWPNYQKKLSIVFEIICISRLVLFCCLKT